MIIYEFIFIGLVLVAVIVGITVCGKPLAVGYAEKMKISGEADSEETRRLKDKVAFLESQVEDLRTQLQSVQESVEFALELKESRADSNAEPMGRHERSKNRP